jgi:hypothetical protein
VIHRMVFTWQETRHLEDAQLRSKSESATAADSQVNARVTNA